MRTPLGRVAGLAAFLYLGKSLMAKRYHWVNPTVIHVADADWVLSTISGYIGQHLARHYDFGPSLAWRIVRNSIVHFLSPPGYFSGKMYQRIHHSNSQVINWTHGRRTNANPEFSRRLDQIGEASTYVDKIVVQTGIGAETLRAEGVDPAKLVHIPLGIDTHLFRPPTRVESNEMRRKLDIPQTSYCIGSFQKDGNGWGEGMSPKWVKGPDTFLEVVRRLRHDFELCVLLTGPARGYVKAGLDQLNVAYRHVWLKDYSDVARHYSALDLYIIASRDEGGPLALLEAMASKVPVVSTRVGMSVDLLSDGDKGLLAEVDDVEGLVASAARVLGDAELRHAIAVNAFQTVQQYDWSIIANRYHEDVYRPLLLEAGYRV